MDAKCAQNLRPAEIVTLARAHGMTAFARAVGKPLLLVRIDEPDGDAGLTLEAALDDAATSAGQRAEPGLGFDTVVGSLADSAKLFAANARPTAVCTGADLRRQLQRAVHFAARLHKRVGAANVFAERISIGRVRTNDVVLRHHSVSKFHAWFECDEDDRFYVHAAKSTNATLVNGVEVPRSMPVRLAPGDEVRFGDVVTVYCPPELLWEALMGVSGPPSSRSGPRSA